MIRPLTSLRAFAAFYTLFFHSGSQFLMQSGLLAGPALNFALNGYLGVSFFFILSGFILQHVYAGRVDDGPQRTAFARARFARIYPVYGLALLLTAGFAFEAQWSALPQLFMLQYWYLPALGAPDNWNFPAWTLSVELFFYICFIPLSLILTRSGLRGTLAATTATALVMVAINGPAVIGPALEASPIAGSPIYIWTPPPLLRLPEFILGILLRQLIALRPVGTRTATATFCAALAGITAVLLADHAVWTANAFAMLIAAMIWALPQMEGSRIFALLSGRTLVLLGGASYALYILQFPVRKWMRLIDIWPSAMAERLAYYPMLIGISVGIFLLFEEPMRRRLRRRDPAMDAAGVASPRRL